MTIDIIQYTKNYNTFLRVYKLKTKDWTREDYRRNLEDTYRQAESFGLKIDREGTGKIYSPKNIQRGYINPCADWEEPYKVPPGNWLYDKDNAYGKGCLCVDKGVDRRSLDIMNSIPTINVDQICDGSREHKNKKANKTPLIAFEYLSKKPINLNTLKRLCPTSKYIVVNDNNYENYRNLCTNDKFTREETDALAMREKRHYKGQKDPWGKLIDKKKKYPNVIIQGKRYNDKQFWEDTASVLSDLGNPYQERPLQNTKSPIIKKKKSSSFDFGSGFDI